jgi:glycosyltransferase involved in cell wall biosynthesis
MRVCIDVQSAISQLAGVGRYTKLLVQNLDSVAGGNTFVLFYFDFLRKGTPFKVPGATHKAIRWCPGRFVQAAWKTIGWPPFDFFAGAADVYHFPNFILPPMRKGKSVVTIHDMSFVRFPQFAEEKNLRYLTAKIHDTVNRADAIITDSQFSADEIKSLLKVDPSKIFAVHPGISSDFSAPPRHQISKTLSEFNLDRPYILTVGTLEPRKNIQFLIEVFERLSGFDGYLVLAGMRGWKYEAIIERIKNSSCASRIKMLNHVDDSRLPALYAGAELFVITSLYEGFGFPPLEAMACGTPVVSSTGGSLPEVLGNGAVLVDGFDAEKWVSHIRNALTDSDTRRRLQESGCAQAAKYRWAETARKTWEVYKKVHTG